MRPIVFPMRKPFSCLTYAFWVLFLLIAPLDAQPQALEESWRWAHFTERDGLPHRHVYYLLETDDGTTWAGTFDGLARYDGYRWHAPGTAAGLPATKPRSMHRRPGGGLFVVVNSRLYAGDQSGFEQIHLPFVFDSEARLPDGSLLLLSRGDLYLYRDGESTPVAGPAGLPREAYIELAQTSTGNVWLLSVDGLYRREGENWVLEQSGRDFGDIAEDSAGQRFASTRLPVRERGLWMWEPGSRPRRYPGGVVDLVEFIAGSADGGLVVVYESGDVLVRWDGEWSMLEPVPAPMEHILSIGFRANGDLWVGTDFTFR